VQLIQHPVQLIPSLNDAVSVVAINLKDKPLCVLEVASPQRSNLQPPIKQKEIMYKGCKHHRRPNEDIKAKVWICIIQSNKDESNGSHWVQQYKLVNHTVDQISSYEASI
jgi:hypothetical protein